MTRISISLGALALLASGLAAQTFDVVSIKPMKDNDNRIMIRQMPGGRFSANGVNLRILIGMAYDVRDFQISGGPSWMATDAFQIDAKADTDKDRIPQEEMRAMLRAMLAERFQLKLHEDQKEMPIFALTVAKGGIKMKESEVPPPSPNPPSPNSPGGPPRGGMVRLGPGQISAQGRDMQGLANLLSQQLGRTVVDQTSLKGTFDFELNWAPDGSQMRMAGPGGAGAGAPPPPVDTNGPTIFTALQESLGLKLENTKGAVKTLIIDSAAKPTEN